MDKSNHSLAGSGFLEGYNQDKILKTKMPLKNKASHASKSKKPENHSEIHEYSSAGPTNVCPEILNRVMEQQTKCKSDSQRFNKGCHCHTNENIKATAGMNKCDNKGKRVNSACLYKNRNDIFNGTNLYGNEDREGSHKFDTETCLRDRYLHVDNHQESYIPQSLKIKLQEVLLSTCQDDIEIDMETNILLKENSVKYGSEQTILTNESFDNRSNSRLTSNGSQERIKKHRSNLDVANKKESHRFGSSLSVGDIPIQRCLYGNQLAVKEIAKSDLSVTSQRTDESREELKVSSPQNIRKRRRKRRTDRTTRLLIVILCLFVISELPQVSLRF